MAAARRFHVRERVLTAEALPLVLPHLVERQHLDALHVAEARRERGGLRHVVRIVRQTGNQDEPDPDRSPERREPASERQGCCPFRSDLWRAGSQVLSEHHEIDRSTQSVSFSPKKPLVSIVVWIFMFFAADISFTAKRC